MAEQPAATASTPAGSGGASSPAPGGTTTTQDAPLLEAAPHGDDDEPGDGRDDNDSTLESDIASTTASITESILEYRYMNGRTYHSERYGTDYFAPNDDQQNDCLDIIHHFLQLILDGKLFHSPISQDVHMVLDVGTGTGIWAIDFADEHPNAEVIGTDLSPMMPGLVPPNLKFEIDDCTQPWTWPADTFDFIHMRYLFGAISDWARLFQQAYHCTRPGGWVESVEIDCNFTSDDDSVKPDSTMALWTKMFDEAAPRLHRSFHPIRDDCQRTGMEAAGFENIHIANYKIPIGGWPVDPKLAEVGRYALLATQNDLDGYSSYIWNNVLNWDRTEFQIFLMEMRKELVSKRIHSYIKVRYVYGRKPGGTQ